MNVSTSTTTTLILVALVPAREERLAADGWPVSLNRWMGAFLSDGAGGGGKEGGDRTRDSILRAVAKRTVGWLLENVHQCQTLHTLDRWPGFAD